MPIVSERKNALLCSRLFFIPASTTKGSIKVVFIQSLLQGLSLHYISMFFTAVGERINSCNYPFLVDINNELKSEFLHLLIAKFDHFLEFPGCVYMHQREGGFARIECL